MQFSISQKSERVNRAAIVVELTIRENGVSLDWHDFKKTYLAEKVADYIRNTINGQRVIYWDNNDKHEGGGE